MSGIFKQPVSVRRGHRGQKLITRLTLILNGCTVWGPLGVEMLPTTHLSVGSFLMIVPDPGGKRFLSSLGIGSLSSRRGVDFNRVNEIDLI